MNPFNRGRRSPTQRVQIARNGVYGGRSTHPMSLGILFMPHDIDDMRDLRNPPRVNPRRMEWREEGGDAHDIAQVWCSRRARRASHSRLDLARLRHLSDSYFSDLRRLFVFFVRCARLSVGMPRSPSADAQRKKEERDLRT
jgi:hypothetical protein